MKQQLFKIAIALLLVISLLPSAPKVVSAKGNPEIGNENSFEIEATATDNVRVKEIHLPNGAVVKGNKATYEVSDNGTYSFKAVDTRGNETKKSIEIRMIDRNAPYVDINEVEETDDSISVEFIYYDR